MAFAAPFKAPPRPPPPSPLGLPVPPPAPLPGNRPPAREGLNPVDRARRAFDSSPLAILFAGLASAILGVASTYAFPETRSTGLTPATALQLLAIFGGMAAMLVGAHMAPADSPAARARRLREAVRALLAFTLLCASLAAINFPFAVMVAILATPWASERIRVVCKWLGK